MNRLRVATRTEVVPPHEAPPTFGLLIRLFLNLPQTFPQIRLLPLQPFHFLAELSDFCGGRRGSVPVLAAYFFRSLPGISRMRSFDASRLSLSFEFIRRPEDRNAEEQSRLDRLRAEVPAVDEGLGLAAELVEMLRKQSRLSLVDCLAKVERSGVKEMQTFAEGFRQDKAAVQAALVEPWSNGPVEGQVNRPKLIERQMQGRIRAPACAGFGRSLSIVPDQNCGAIEAASPGWRDSHRG